jgi:membrane fusion protein, multidrug efflux system
MSKKKRITIITGIVFIIILLVLAFFRLQDTLSSSSKRPSLVPIISAENPKRTEMINSMNQTGDIIADQQAGIFSKVSGNIEKIYVDIGQRVIKDQVLALIDTTIYSQNVKQAYGSYLQAEANTQNAKTNYERNKKLLDQNLIAQQDLDNSKTAYDIAYAQKEVASANYKNAKTQLSYCRVTAPFSGYITKRNYDAGAYVTAGSQSTTIFILMDLDQVKIYANIPEKNITFIDIIKDAQVIVDAYKDKSFTAVLRRTSGALDINTRTMQVEFDIENREHLLKPGMYAQINLVLEKRENILTLPSNVILNDEKGDYVFKLNSDTTAMKTYVQTGFKQEKQTEIVSGINDSDKIIILGYTQVKDKMKVKVAR